MRAVQLVTPGAPLVDVELAVEEPRSGEVAVRIEAAGVCRSDLHYRSGFPALGELPRTLGHEIAGEITATGAGVALDVGTRVCLHYLVSCGECRHCSSGFEQFCETGQMLGKELNGGFAETIVVPQGNAFPIPDLVTSAAAAVMMCSTATVFHALAVGRITDDSSVVVFGAGGLGQSAVQLAGHLGDRVVAVDPNPAKRELAASFGATAVDPGDDPAAAIRGVLGEGADIALDLVGSAAVMRSALDVLAPMGRAVAVGLTAESVAVGPYTDLVIGEKQLVGSSDHLASEIPQLLDLAAAGSLDVEALISRTVPLSAVAINDTLDRMAAWSDDVRTVVEG
ncbi:MAG: zinc-binding dehydrogenase [Acidimicrobiia bacterium]|nr:zinc-binding dehydrogenase [Acidimicrobiia bacterium]